MADTIKQTGKRVWVGLGLGGLTDGQQVVAMSPFSLLALNLLCLFLDWSKQCNLILGNLQYDRKKMHRCPYGCRALWHGRQHEHSTVSSVRRPFDEMCPHGTCTTTQLRDNFLPAQGTLLHLS